MLFSAVTELLGHLAGLPAIDDALEALRQGSPAEKMAGLTSPAKALVTALAATELRRPALVLVEDERRAASLLEALQFFYRTLNGNSAAPVLLLPALDTLPGVGAGPHPEILEVRASTLARLVSGQCSIVVAPIDATLLSFAAPQFYESLSLSLTRDAEISLKEVIAHLAKTGYIRTELVEMEGHFSVRGGILDVFTAEAAKPVRIELLGDVVESLREFDPETQRSTGPVNRVILPPLTEFPLTASRRDDEDLYFPKFQTATEETVAERAATLFDLREGALLVLDEPEEIAQRAAKSRDRLLADSASLAGDAAVPFVLPEDQWKKALDRQQRFSLEELALHRDGRDPRTLKVQPTARYHGQIQAFLGEIRGRLRAGDEVLIAAVSSCACSMPTTCGCMFRWNEWIWFRIIAPWRAPSRNWIAWVALLGPRAKPACASPLPILPTNCWNCTRSERRQRGMDSLRTRPGSTNSRMRLNFQRRPTRRRRLPT